MFIGDIMKFAKIRDVKTPSRGTDKSAGIDFFVPNYSEEYLSIIKEKNPYIQIDKTGILLHSLKRILIPSGVKVAVPEGYDLCVHNKGGVAVKKGIIFGAQVIDEDYQGEILISVINVSDETQLITWGEKITQMILREVNYENAEECTLDELKSIYEQRNSQRGEGALGSTGTH
jgi:dUTP pyrophosphatase